jgi:NTP pyrophosphatase (non-canonical NTP hydrolase)
VNRLEYPTFVKTIWSEPEEHTERGISIAALGLIGECGEVCEILIGDDDMTSTRELVDECGDVLYYATVLADWKGYHVKDIWPDMKPEVMTRHEAGLVLVRDAKEVSERVKKLIRDGKDPLPEDIRARLRQVLFSLFRVLRGVGADLFDAMDENVRKLEVRYNHVLSGEEGAHQARAKEA